VYVFISTSVGVFIDSLNTGTGSGLTLPPVCGTVSECG